MIETHAAFREIELWIRYQIILNFKLKYNRNLIIIKTLLKIRKIRVNLYKKKR